WTYTLTVPGGPVAPPPNSVLSNTPGTPFNHYLMDRQNYRDQQVYNLGQDDCCQVNERVPEGSHANTVLVSNTMSTPWTPAANGLVAPNSAHVYFAEDFVVPTGVKLYVSGMDWHFGPDARLIVNRGSYVRFTNCTLQGSLDEECEPQRWPGVRVEGTSTADQQPPVNGDQGYLSLNNSVIKDAVVGVWCARESSGGGSGTYGYYGGIVVDNGSTFQNCITGVKIEHYNGFSQLSNFTNTYFVTDSNWPGGTPMSHANISYTKTVYFTNCRFANTTPYHTASNGIGVYVFDGQVYINGGAYSTSYFDNLYIGVANLIGVLNPSTVNHMDFRNNQYGIYDMGSRFARYTNNSFTVPDMFLNQPPVGLYLWQSQLYTVERNVFNGTPARNNNVGIYFLGYTPGSSNWAYLNSRIYDNQFQDLRVGTLVKHIHRGNGAGNEQEGLSLFCGDYTHNIADIALLASSIIRSNQGYPSASPPQLSGNRFLDLANCTNNWDWFLDPQWNSVIGYPSGMTTTVFRNEDPLCDVLCDSWPYFFDVEVLGSGPWSTSATCGYGDLDDPPQFQEMRANYAAAKSGLEAAENTYNSNLDAGEKPDLMSLLTEAEPPMASNALRDALLANGPLSDDVLLAMVKHEPAMDPWHLTQVLVDNVKLNTGVIETARASGLLSPFYMGIVDDAQEGSGVTWKQVLEQEIGQHRLEKAHALSQLAYLYTTDSTVLHGTDSLRALLLADSDPSYHQLREEVRMASQDWTSGINEAATEDFSTWNGFGNYQDIQSFGANHGGHWSELTAGETASLREDVEGGEAGAAYAAAILWEIDSSTYVPTVEMPSGIGVPAPKMSPSGSVSQDRPRLALYPNPANTEAYLTWPVELKGDRIAVLDAQGRILLEQEVLGNGLTHLALQDLPMGFYKLVLRGSGLSSSFSIVR
ncbi:MAG: hypothetical protein KBH07_08330, partial [Flavobacteriales bacterium]|nr:hypothetical protein [Flavobacteriales bacterium]